MSEIRKIIREILFEGWETMTAGAMIDTFGRGSSSKPMIPLDQRINDYERLSFESDIVKRDEAFDAYQWEGPTEVGDKIVYSIDTHTDKDKRNADFIIDVEFSKPKNSPIEDVWEWKVKTATGENALFTNRDRITNVLSTLDKILESFVKNEEPTVVLFKAGKSNNPTEINITNMFINNTASNTPQKYVFKEVEDVIYITRQDSTTVFNKLKDLLTPPANKSGQVHPDANGY